MRSKIFEDITKSALSLDNYYKDDSEIVDIIQFSQVWGSTALGFDNCAGGSMMTNAITTVVIKSDNSCDVFFNGRKAYNIQNPNKVFMDDVNKRMMKPVSKSHLYKESDRYSVKCFNCKSVIEFCEQDIRDGAYIKCPECQTEVCILD